ncbi:MAG: flagellar hook-basal body complex protein [Lachnospiraceae bacterium]|nr:flagellar hook-basal body complex protein [Lachnospiraceae bacterium]
MMRSLYSGVAGLKTHQTKMDVIGNNIANVNTVAFKSSSMTFSELMSQTTQKSSGPNSTLGTGGTNAKQIGLGVKAGAINVNITTQGASQATGNPFDIMITGENFFVVNNGSENFFTRDGSFYVDGSGNLAMTSTGYNVMGWGVDEATGEVRQNTVTALRIMSAANMTYPPEATSQAYLSGILDKNDTDVTSANGKVVNLNFFDSLGYSYTAKFVFKQSNDTNEYSLELDRILDSTGQEVDLTTTSGAPVFGDNAVQDIAGKVSFDAVNYEWSADGKTLTRNGTVVADLNRIIDGGALKAGDEVADATTGQTVQEQLDNIAQAYGYEGSTEEFLNLRVTITDPDTDVVVNELSISDMLVTLQSEGPDDAEALPTFIGALSTDNTSFDTSGRYYEGVKVSFDPATGIFAGINGQADLTSLSLKLYTAGVGDGNFSDIEIDLSEISMFDNKGTSTIGATSGDFDGLGAGRRLGEMIGVSVQQDGMIYASYDNGMTKLLGQIATANFANASGLEKAGDNLYSATLNSGEFDGIGEDVTANGGYMSTGQLEMSNVDLSAEFTEMITTQRGFQANSRIITVSDTLLEELTNLKR